jgi:hypothetical protein
MEGRDDDVIGVGCGGVPVKAAGADDPGVAFVRTAGAAYPGLEVDRAVVDLVPGAVVVGSFGVE